MAVEYGEVLAVAAVADVVEAAAGSAWGEPAAATCAEPAAEAAVEQEAAVVIRNDARLAGLEVEEGRQGVQRTSVALRQRIASDGGAAAVGDTDTEGELEGAVVANRGDAY
jgi:hypothetical protein